MYLQLKNWAGGLDGRNYKLSQPAGTLVIGNNGHITSGADFEKRKAFVKQERPGGAAGVSSLVAGTFGMQEVATGMLVFSSSDLSASLFPPPFTYQRLQHAAVYPTAYVAYDPAKHAMTSVIHSCVFGGKAFVAARFADGYTFCYYDGLLVSDFIAGLILPALAGDNTNIAKALTALINATTSYRATQAANVVTVFGDAGKTFSVATTTDTGVGTLAASLIDNGIEAATGIAATGQFTFKAGSNNAANTITAVTIGATFARGFLTSTGVNVANNETVTINAKVYTFKNALTPAEGEILIGSTAANSLRNLISAINHTGVPGVDYKCAAIHPEVRAVESVLSDVLTIVARVAGTAANAYVTQDTSANLGWGAATMVGGTASTSLLAATVLWTDTPANTASLVAASINANTATSGYTASANSGTVYINSAANSLANGASVSVTCTGNVCVGDCAIQFTHVTTGTANVTDVRVNGVVITTAAVNWATDLSALVTALAANINANSGVSGYLAYASGSILFVSKVTTSSADAAVSVVVTLSSANVAVSAAGTLPVFARLSLTSALCGLTPRTRNLAAAYQPSAPVKCLPSGGVGPYTFLWSRVAGSDPYFVMRSGATSFFSGATSTLQSVIFNYIGPVPSGASKNSTTKTASFICTVTDALGATVTTAPVNVFAA